MKAITVQQPWAWAIIHGGKTVENRRTLWKYRGPLAIHAGARWSERGNRDPNVCAAAKRVFPTPEPRHNEDVLRNWDENIRPAVRTMSAIIGVIDFVGAHWAHPHCCDDNPWAEHSYTEHGSAKTITAIVHYELANPRAVTPIDCKGRLGLWTVPDDIEELLAA